MRNLIQNTRREKRTAFFAKLSQRQQASEETRTQTEDRKPVGMQAGDDGYLIRCPKCGKMVDRGRVAKRKYQGSKVWGSATMRMRLCTFTLKYPSHS